MQCIHLSAHHGTHVAAAGVRIGALYTYNADLLEAWGNIAHFSACSSFAQWQLQPLFDDDEFIDGYITENAARLEANCQILLDGFDAIGVSYVRPQV